MGACPGDPRAGTPEDQLPPGSSPPEHVTRVLSHGTSPQVPAARFGGGGKSRAVRKDGHGAGRLR